MYSQIINKLENVAYYGQYFLCFFTLINLPHVVFIVVLKFKFNF